VWTGGVVTFNQFYTELPRLLESLNQQVALHHIPVSIRSYEPDAVNQALSEAATPEQKRSLRKEGVLCHTEYLAPA
jgi:hypothetical protein